MKIVANVPSMRVACGKCRHSSPTLTNAGRVELAIECRCPVPDLVLVLGFPGKDLNIPLEPTGGGGA